jgi:hypothetical protein
MQVGAQKHLGRQDFSAEGQINPINDVEGSNERGGPAKGSRTASGEAHLGR